MNYAEKMAASQRGKHDHLDPQDKLDAARQELKDVRNPSKFDLQDGLSTAGHAGVVGLGMNTLLNKTGFGATMTGGQRAALGIGATCIAAIGGYTKSQAAKREASEAALTIKDISHMLYDIIYGLFYGKL